MSTWHGWGISSVRRPREAAGIDARRSIASARDHSAGYREHCPREDDEVEHRRRSLYATDSSPSRPDANLMEAHRGGAAGGFTASARTPTGKSTINPMPRIAIAGAV